MNFNKYGLWKMLKKIYTRITWLRDLLIKEDYKCGVRYYITWAKKWYPYKGYIYKLI